MIPTLEDALADLIRRYREDHDYGLIQVVTALADAIKTVLND